MFIVHSVGFSEQSMFSIYIIFATSTKFKKLFIIWNVHYIQVWLYLHKWFYYIFSGITSYSVILRNYIRLSKSFFNQIKNHQYRYTFSQEILYKIYFSTVRFLGFKELQNNTNQLCPWKCNNKQIHRQQVFLEIELTLNLKSLLLMTFHWIYQNYTLNFNNHN